MNEAYVKEYAILEKSHWWFIARRKIIRHFLQKNIPTGRSQAKVLNVGAAGGASSAWLSEFGKVVSLENEPLFIEHLQKLNIDVTEGSVEALPFEDNHFDLVCAFDVLEHVEADTKAMQELLRVCKTGSIVCITVPAFNMLWSFHDDVNHHHRRYTRNTLGVLLSSFKFAARPQISYFNFLLFAPILLARKLSRLNSRRKQAGQSDFTYFKGNRFINKVMEKIFSLELRLIPFLKFPFGVSLLAVVKKGPQ